jgi:hypothetical protein
LLIAQFQTRRPAPWLFSTVECVGAGLAFAPATSLHCPIRSKTSDGFAVLLLDRVERAVRLAPVRADRQLAEGAQ